MGGIASPNLTPGMAPPPMNPILDEIDAAHSRLSPDAQAAIEKAHGIAAPGGTAASAGIAAPNGPAIEPPPGGGIQAPAPTMVGSGITPPGAESPKLTSPAVSSQDQETRDFYRTHPGRYPMDEKFDGDNVSSAVIKPPAMSLGSQMPETPATHIGGKVSPELSRLTAPDTGQHNKQNTGTPGVNQIHNPWARVPLQILDALGRGFFPGVEMGIPGTSGHHDVLVHQRQAEDTAEQNAAKAQTEEELQRAQAGQATANAEHLTAEAEALKNPQAKQATNLVELFQKDPAAFTRYQEATQKAVATKTPQFIREEGASGKIIGVIDGAGAFHSADDPKIDPQAKAIMDASKGKQPTNATEMWISENPHGTAEDLQTFLAKQPKEAGLSADDQAILKTVGGDPTVPVKDQPLPILQKFLAKKKEPAPQHPPQDQMLVPDGHGGYVSQLVRPGSHVSGDAMKTSGVNTLNTPTQNTRNAGERSETMLDIDSRIRTALNNPELRKGTGPIAGRLSEIQGKYGSLPHDLAELQNDLISYGAFQAGLHPVRGIGALEYFEKVMGGLKQNPEELLGKLDSNKATAESVLKQAGKSSGGGSNVAQPKSKAEYDALPKGAHYMKDGQEKIKQ